jgi:predicted oxidoreductase
MVPSPRKHVLHGQRVVATALEMGICTFDHADVYTFGKAEKVFGQLIKEDKGLRNKVTLQSKAGIRISGLKEEIRWVITTFQKNICLLKWSNP